MATYPKELTDLVKEYLTDGIITSKERQVLLKKAEALGINTEEFDLYIDAQQQKADQQIEAAASKKRGITCPFCGAAVPSLADKCPSCGENITAEATEELKEIFEKLEDALEEFKSDWDSETSRATVERYVRKAKMYYGNNPKVQKILEEIQEESKNASAYAENKAQKKEKQARKEKIAERNDKIITSLLTNKLFIGCAGYIIYCIIALIAGGLLLYCSSSILGNVLK